ncbi:MAG TPA: glycosyltransferase [Chitinophagaceae bacterium]|nr:glycosyltransferase [Chitinophagaceae bacterium]
MQQEQQITSIKFSIIIPVYNRPAELDELLSSLLAQTTKDFEVVVVEDGSSSKSDEVCSRYIHQLSVRYHYKENTGPALTRNAGMAIANGNYFIILDSDCILPPEYIEVVRNRLNEDFLDAYGGPDRAHESFNKLQKAIDYSMTSFFTTGGIRGGGEKMDQFHPRSFNMGISRRVFEAVGGFPDARFAKAKAAGEDIELSMRIREAGFRIALLKEAFVYHKRRISLRKFFDQVYNFGYARITLNKRNKGALKAVHILPAAFVIGNLVLLLSAIVLDVRFALPLALYIFIVLLDAGLKTKSIAIALLATLTSIIQLTGYGLGFLAAVKDQYITKT